MDLYRQKKHPTIARSALFKCILNVPKALIHLWIDPSCYEIRFFETLRIVSAAIATRVIDLGAFDLKLHAQVRNLDFGWLDGFSLLGLSPDAR